MTRAQTMDVINGATDILNEINKLRLPVQTWDWSPEIEWWPGDPLYPAPIKQEGCGDDDCGWCSEYYVTPTVRDEEGIVIGGGQHIRPMFETFDDDVDFELDEWFMDCEDCQVAGSGSEHETKCWFCGKELSGLWRPSAWNEWISPTRMMSFNEMAENSVANSMSNRVFMYDVGDSIEDFDSGSWLRANNFGREGITFDLSELTPWQDTLLREYAAADADATRRMMLMPARRNSGRAYMDRLIAMSEAYFQGTHIIDIEATEIPNAYQITESRNTRRPPQVQRNYPTSSNPTQERRRRNH